ncbi:MAG: hypothetical protein BWY09_02519 [Candidatus Hydrogenedentes bacterium ADurb.Bin179]|nr:MAG: hypothetical protein BWY09_02519 [Candidatus Hydrogenedentes bacterium ADurb.Bin179]
MQFSHTVPDQPVAHRLGGNLEGGQYRHAIIKQGTQGTSELGHLILYNEGAHRGYTQKEGIKLTASRFAAIISERQE